MHVIRTCIESRLCLLFLIFVFLLPTQSPLRPFPNVLATASRTMLSNGDGPLFLVPEFNRNISNVSPLNMILIISWRDIPHNRRKMPCTISFSNHKADYETPVVIYRENHLFISSDQLVRLNVYYFPMLNGIL